ncbi:MAG TPA: carbamoyltransferase C-terminal domain-containing protein [Blastocatellia bacterium]
MIVLGINAYHGDASAAIVLDGELIAAVEEERFARIKHIAGFPADAVKACLSMAGISASDVDHFAVSRNPWAHAARKAIFALTNRPSISNVADRARNASRVRSLDLVIAEGLGLDRKAVRSRLHYIEHHPAHLASSFFVSPFDEAAICAIDGFGDFVSTSSGIGRGNSLQVNKRTYFPHSLGLVYLAVTQYLGFPKYGDEYKVMGLAPYGRPALADKIRRLIHLKPRGGFELDLSYFCHWNEGVSMSWDSGEPVMGPVFSSKLENLLGPARRPDAPVTSRHEDIAASLQLVFEECVFHILRDLHRSTNSPNLCLAGGCAMNSVANGKIRENTPFQDVYIQPASGDNGTALGAAYYVWNQILDRPRGFQMTHGYWGPKVSDGDAVGAAGARFAEIEAQSCRVESIETDEHLFAEAARRIADGQIVGWFQGRMEWGARALGSRSILADPRRADMREIINTKIKFRERFRPFAPSILVEALDEYFTGAVPDPFMIQVYPVRPGKRAVIPAVTHVDGSGRVQTVSRESNPGYWRLIDAFRELTGVPVLLNTSFNENEPIVNTPAQALDCFLRTSMDALFIGNMLIARKEAQAAPGHTPSTVGYSTGAVLAPAAT